MARLHLVVKSLFAAMKIDLLYTQLRGPPVNVSSGASFLSSGNR